MTVNKYTDRLSKSDLSKELEQKLRDSAPDKIRLGLFMYLSRYNDSYYFSQLENAFPLVKKSLSGENSLSSEEASLAKQEIEFGMYEYFISLNHISEALSIIYNNQVLDKSLVFEIINHIWEAYSCNETEFISRESDYLSKNL